MTSVLSCLTKNRTTFALFVLVSFALLAGFYAPNIINLSLETKPSTLPLEPSRYCTLSTQQCKQQNVGIKLDTDIAKPLKPAQVSVSWPNNNSDKLMLTLRGLEMDLGVVKFPILKQSDGHYQGSITLPICTDSRMTWIGTLSDQQGNKVYASIRMEK